MHALSTEFRDQYCVAYNCIQHEQSDSTYKVKLVSQIQRFFVGGNDFCVELIIIQIRKTLSAVVKMLLRLITKSMQPKFATVLIEFQSGPSLHMPLFMGCTSRKSKSCT